MRLMFVLVSFIYVQLLASCPSVEKYPPCKAVNFTDTTRGPTRWTPHSDAHTRAMTRVLEL